MKPKTIVQTALICAGIAYAAWAWWHDVSELLSGSTHLCVNGEIEHAVNGCELP
jgi:hypothetical protein